MKAYLAFSLPEDTSEFTLASKGVDWACVSFALDNWLRNQLKYGHSFQSADEALEAARTELHQELDNHDVTFDML